MKRLIELFCVFGLIYQSSAMSLTAFAEGDEYRLPLIVKPALYELEITLPQNFENDHIYNGNVTITIDVAKNNSTKEIKLHQKSHNITKAQFIRLNTTKPIDLKINPPDQETDLLTFSLDQELKGEGHKLYLEFNGVLTNTYLYGFYYSTYLQEGETKYVASTQFEPTHAREAFPCFDEPSFKAPFKIKISAPKEYTALSNTNGTRGTGDSLVTTVFEKTKKISTYLVAFVISQYNSTDGEKIDGLKTKVWSRDETANLRQFAASVAPEVLKTMENYTGFMFNKFGLGKLDNVVIPDFSAGAMENWGLVTYREPALLCDNSSVASQKRVATTVAHELAHQWFGDVVTLDWWTDVFLNEGFATYFAYHALESQFSEWDLPGQFVVDQMQPALRADSKESSLPLSSYVYKPSDISKRFDTISYNKGGSILRMVKHMLGITDFKKGLTDYINSHVFDSTTAVQLWASLGKFVSSANLDTLKFEDVMTNWTVLSGYPVITVKKNGDDVMLSQKAVVKTSNTSWYVPITYASSTFNSDASNTSVYAWLVPGKDLTLENVLAQTDWFVLNVQETGFYRVNYDTALWTDISNTLKSKPEDIHVLNRAQMIDDQFSFAESGTKPYGDVLEFFNFLVNDKDYHSWYAAFTGFGKMLDRIENSTLRQSITKYLTGLIQNVYKTVSFDETDGAKHIDTLKQILVLDWACKLGVEHCKDTTKKIFQADIKNVSSDLIGIVYCNALRYSDNDSDWDLVFDEYKKAKIPFVKTTILNSLGCSTDETILKKFMIHAINDQSDSISRQDVSSIFTSVYSSNPEGPEIVLSFLMSKHSEMIKFFGRPTEYLNLFTAVADKITSDKTLQGLQSFLKMSANELTNEEKIQIESSINTISENLVAISKLEEQLASYFKDDDDKPGDDANIAEINFGVFSAMILIVMARSYYF